MYEVFERLLKERGIKASDVSKATGIPQSTFSDWKSGRSKPKDEKLQKIAEYFGVTEKYLRTGRKTFHVNINTNDLHRAIDKAIVEKDRKSVDGEIFQHPLYYLDDETAEIVEAMAINPKLKALLYAQRNMSDDEINASTAFHNAMIDMKQKEERLDEDDPC